MGPDDWCEGGPSDVGGASGSRDGANVFLPMGGNEGRGVESWVVVFLLFLITGTATPTAMAQRTTTAAATHTSVLRYGFVCLARLASPWFAFAAAAPSLFGWILLALPDPAAWRSGVPPAAAAEFGALSLCSHINVSCRRLAATSSGFRSTDMAAINKGDANNSFRSLDTLSKSDSLDSKSVI